MLCDPHDGPALERHIGYQLIYQRDQSSDVSPAYILFGRDA